MPNTKQMGEDFLAKNKTNPDVTVTPSGLQYEVLVRVDEGESPTLDSIVEVHYHGTTIDDEVFDSSVVRGETIEFPLRNVIQGWQEGVQLMKVGETFKFYIPADLAYGDYSPSPLIPAGSTLIFEVQLFTVKN